MIYLVIAGNKAEFDTEVEKYLADMDTKLKLRGLPPLRYERTAYRVTVKKDTFVYTDRPEQIRHFAQEIFKGQKVSVVLWGTAEKRPDIKEINAIIEEMHKQVHEKPKSGLIV